MSSGPRLPKQQREMGCGEASADRRAQLPSSRQRWWRVVAITRESVRPPRCPSWCSAFGLSWLALTTRSYLCFRGMVPIRAGIGSRGTIRAWWACWLAVLAHAQYKMPESTYFPTSVSDGRCARHRRFRSGESQSAQRYFERHPVQYTILDREQATRIDVPAAEQALTYWLVHNAAGLVVYDVGAAIGFATLNLAKVASRVVAFEPDPTYAATVPRPLSPARWH